jgi:hypothetical protein
MAGFSMTNIVSMASALNNHGDAEFCRDLTGTYHTHRPPNPLIAEYWRDPQRRVVDARTQGLGFDAAWNDRLRNELWRVVSVASAGAGAVFGLAGLAAALALRPNDLPDSGAL